MTRRMGIAAGAMVTAGFANMALVGCVPDPAPAPTRLAITTELTWCGGVIPPPGESWCHTSATSTEVQVLRRREVIATGTTGSDGRLFIEVDPGAYSVAAVDPPAYMECDAPSVTAVARQDTAVLQTCTVFAP